jgi:hypothetical protein
MDGAAAMTSRLEGGRAMRCKLTAIIEASQGLSNNKEDRYRAVVGIGGCWAPSNIKASLILPTKCEMSDAQRIDLGMICARSCGAGTSSTARFSLLCGRGVAHEPNTMKKRNERSSPSRTLLPTSASAANIRDRPLPPHHWT